MEPATILRGESIAASLVDDKPETTPAHATWLAAARIAWVGWTALLAIVFGMSVPLRYDEVVQSPFVRDGSASLGITPDFYAGYTVGLEILFALVFVAVGVLIFTRKPAGWMSLYVSLTLVTAGVGAAPLLHIMSALTRKYQEMDTPVTVLALLAWSLLHLFTYIFPDGRFIPRWTYAVSMVTTGLLVPWFLLPVDSPLNPWSWHPALIAVLMLAIGGIPAATQIYRYSRHTDEQYRQQIKWVIYGLTIAVVGATAAFLPLALPGFKPVVTGATLRISHSGDSTLLIYQLASTTLFCLTAILLPITIAISILRYRLWAIDLIISRTLVYVPLTAVLAGGYAASIALFQKAFVGLTGDRSDTAIVITTLVFASLFTPIKNGLQTRVDKRFKDVTDPTRRLKQLGERIEAVNSVRDPRLVARRTVNELTRGMNAQGGAIYMGRGDAPHLAYSTEGWNGNEEMSVVIRHEGRNFGRLALGARNDGSAYSSIDMTTAQELADKVGELIALETGKGIL